MANNISQLISQMTREGVLDHREIWSWSWGNRATCNQLFQAIFRSVDSTFEQYHHLPEYEDIIAWMISTQDKGLLLMGDCGRGKSVILNGVLPVLFRMKNRVLQPVHAQDMGREIPDQQTFRSHRPWLYIDRLLHSSFPAIDELGVEPMLNDYGERYEGFNLGLNAAERYHRPVFITTNLCEEQIYNRYGERTMDRLAHLCRSVHFSGESLRK